MFGSGYLWRELSIRGAFRAITRAHGVENCIARALRVDHRREADRQKQKIHHKDREESPRRTGISQSILSRLKESRKRFLNCRLDMIVPSFSTSAGVYAWDTLSSIYF
jgi:hypothetical protein